MDLFRDLNNDETIVFRAWARENYIPGTQINTLWHPVVQEECKTINIEADEQNQIRAREYIETEVSETLEIFHSTDGEVSDYTFALDSIMHHVKNDRLDNVHHFMETAGSDIPREPEIPKEDKLRLYFGLILEELFEYAVACGREGVNVFNDLLIAYENKTTELQIEDSSKKCLEPNLVESLDALIDLEYVLYNLVIGAGMFDIFHRGHVRVHGSNMSKFCSSYEQAKTTADMYKNGEIKEGQRILTDIDEIGDKFVIRREGDLKILKSKDYYKANLKDLFI